MRIPPSLLLAAFLIPGAFTESLCQEKHEAILRLDALSGTMVIYQEEDLKILENIFSDYGEFQGPTADLMLMLAGCFAKSPYVEQSLENEPEVLVVNLREFDCTTFVESCLAISRTILSGKHDFEQFTKELRQLRYRKSVVDGYTSRIHYFSDWIYLNNQKKLIRDVSQDLGGTPLSKEINFMSTHPDSYRQLSKDKELVEIIAMQERELSKRKMYYVPKGRIGDMEADLKGGDIVGITTGLKGLDIIHVGVIWKKPDGSVHLLHASSKYMQVLISEDTLEDYLAHNKSASGIMIARPL